MKSDSAVDLVVCVHNAFQEIRSCLESIVAHTDVPYRLILVDDGSDQETRDYIRNFARYNPVLLIRNETARGYTRAANQGLKAAAHSSVVVLNSDTLVTPGWLGGLLECAASAPEIGIVGPLSNTASWQSVPEVVESGDWAKNPLPPGMSLTTYAGLIRRHAKRRFPELPFINGFCMLIKRNVIEAIGYFNEDLYGDGYGEENDYCRRAAAAGWRMAVADHVYVYHHQSKSYGHERRKQLCEKAHEALLATYGVDNMEKMIRQCRDSLVLESIRARIRTLPEKCARLRDGRGRWEGRRVLFLLPITKPFGGVNVILREAEAMMEMGVDVGILNLEKLRPVYETYYPACKVPVVYMESEKELADIASPYDAVVACPNHTVSWLKELPQRGGQVKGYYIQDFEPLFYPEESQEFRNAWDSYTLIPDLVRFTKTRWNERQLNERIGVDAAHAGPSVNLDLFHPSDEWLAVDGSERPVVISAMIRPSTPYRGAKLTMDIFGQLKKRYGRKIRVVTFGSEADEPFWKTLPPFEFEHRGLLSPEQCAAVLKQADLFVDLSTHQAMGLTAMEAAASGAAVVITQHGGAGDWVAHEKNGILVDTRSPDDILHALGRLIEEPERLERIRREGLKNVCGFYPEKAAYRILEALFPAQSL